MIVQNLLDKPTVFQLGRRSTTLPALGTWALPDADEKAFRDARAYEDSVYLEILEGPKIKQDLSSRTLPAWGTITLAATTNLDNELVKIRTMASGKEVVFGFGTPAGAIPVAIGETATTAATALAAAINAAKDCPVSATSIAGVVYVHNRTLGKAGSTVGITATHIDIAVAGGTPVTINTVDYTPLFDGVYGAAVGIVMQTVTATGTSVTLVTGLPSISHVVVQVRDAAGAVAAYTGTVSWVNGVITADTVVATNKVVFMIFG